MAVNTVVLPSLDPVAMKSNKSVGMKQSKELVLGVYGFTCKIRSCISPCRLELLAIDGSEILDIKLFYWYLDLSGGRLSPSNHKSRPVKAWACGRSSSPAFTLYHKRVLQFRPFVLHSLWPNLPAFLIGHVTCRRPLMLLS